MSVPESVAVSQENRNLIKRRFPIGAEVESSGVHFRVWSPKSPVAVQLSNNPESFEDSKHRVELSAEPNGYYSAHVHEAKAGMCYKFVVNSGAFPDPASRFQPQGPHGPSQIIRPDFRWTDSDWKGISRRGQIIYEMHIGTFTPDGTWSAAKDQLLELADLGVTVLEIMPVADFAGAFGWGYDGVNLFAPTRLYGSPDEFRSFVDRAHALKLGVILDVVYNHLGPSGNYLWQYSENYFSKRYKNEWGDPLNFDDEDSGPVREFFLTNAAYWISEFHLDGLRLDATQQIFDASPEHVISELTRTAREIAGEREVLIVSENEPQETRLLRSPSQQGFNTDAVWNDDFHHTAMVALTGRSEAYYTDYRGTPQEFISAAKHGFLYQGQWYVWQKQRRGTPALDIEPAQFIAFLQNHDQVANSLRGQRLHELTSPGLARALTALLLLGPSTPMLFQGQEFQASTPFLYFADHEPDLAVKIVEGRRQFLSQFRSLRSVEMDPYISDPSDKNSFQSCKLDFADRKKNSGIYQMHRDLLRLRRNDSVFANPKLGGMDGAVLSQDAFLLRFFGEGGDDRLIIVNLGIDLRLGPIPEPLIAPPAGHTWYVLWSSEDPAYGGSGTPGLGPEEKWTIPGHSTLVFKPQTRTNGKTNSPN
jgi:maltooligosyltrehalose trehalohydrolase